MAKKIEVSVPVPRQAGCEHCNYSLEVWSAFLKRFVRCGRCTVIKPPNDPSGLQRLTAREKRMRKKAAKAVVSTAILAVYQFGSIPSRLVSTHVILKRHAAFGTGLPADEDGVYDQTRFPPLDPDTQAVVTALIKSSPAGVKYFVWDYYGSEMSMDQMAKKRRMTRRSLDRYHHERLAYLRERFTKCGHPDLVALVTAQP